MGDEDDLKDTIRENAKGPAKAAGDSGSVEQHPLRDQIEADRYLNAKKAAKAKRLGMRITKLVPPGTA
ncbi:MAG: hypothetical protein L6R28_03910 [Planctomycetes bacterium]|nr:hypothetical protein [Planctomycetota bacterium]